MGKKPSSSILGFILVAGLITLAVTGLRLLGETQNWPGFSKELGGMSIVGIVWLVPIFGVLFGRRLAESGSRPKSFARGALPCIVGLGIVIGAFAMLVLEKSGEELERGLMIVGFLGPAVGVLFTLFAWPAAFLSNFLYAILARVPVIVVQYVTIANKWGTHYEKAPNPDMTADETAFGLMMAQLVIWIPFTLFVGGLFAAIGAATVRKR